MIQIRSNVFETNSSSSHSVSIRKLNEYYSTSEIKDSFYIHDDGWKGCINFWDSMLVFDRSPFKPLLTFKDKICYAIASFGSERIEEIEAIMYEMIPGLKKISYDTVFDFDSHKRVTFYGQIDAQSCGVLSIFLCEHNITLREFLLNKKYIVFIDGDEYNIKEKLFDGGLLHIEDFEKV